MKWQHETLIKRFPYALQNDTIFSSSSSSFVPFNLEKVDVHPLLFSNPNELIDAICLSTLAHNYLSAVEYFSHFYLLKSHFFFPRKEKKEKSPKCSFGNIEKAKHQRTRAKLSSNNIDFKQQISFPTMTMEKCINATKWKWNRNKKPQKAREREDKKVKSMRVNKLHLFDGHRY